ncbi:asparaginyl-tRNA synthetase [Auricularia subglabra TFB-10046 SS5]|nr:asparaginyl-tRNA synthetase [Auricularia subglabra TFB-10046 SS5]
MSFGVLSDSTNENGLQLIFDDPTTDLSALTTGSSVRVSGKLVASPGAKQDRELQVTSFQVVGSCDPETYPIQKKELSTEFLRTLPHLRPRTAAHASILRERNRLTHGLHTFFQEHDFLHIHTPVLTQNDCEGGGETFTLSHPAPEIFGHPAHLTVSAQLHLEALASALPRVYTLAPAFRAERSATSRHLSEFWMLEAELAFADTLDEVMDVVERAVRSVVPPALSGEEPWPRITYTRAVELLDGAAWGDRLSSVQERWLAEEWAGGRPVFVTDYPAAQKPFYMLPSAAPSAPGRGTVACFDLLVPRLGELAGGSLREHRLEHLRVPEGGGFEWYRDLRRWGTTPHGGFGLGFERLVAWATGAESVRECLAFPRWPGRWLM